MDGSKPLMPRPGIRFAANTQPERVIRHPDRNMPALVKQVVANRSRIRARRWLETRQRNLPGIWQKSIRLHQRVISYRAILDMIHAATAHHHQLLRPLARDHWRHGVKGGSVTRRFGLHTGLWFRCYKCCMDYFFDRHVLNQQSE
jgi:hypothetical protein